MNPDENVVVISSPRTSSARPWVKWLPGTNQSLRLAATHPWLRRAVGM